MLNETERHVADAVTAGTPDAPVLLASRCSACGTETFPPKATCPNCCSKDTQVVTLPRQGVLWTYTTQEFPPKSPPYSVPPDRFSAFCVGYVQLGDSVRVEGRIHTNDVTHLRIGLPMELTLIRLPVNDTETVVTFGFTPVEESA
jgi:uncharacterized protein